MSAIYCFQIHCLMLKSLMAKELLDISNCTDSEKFNCAINFVKERMQVYVETCTSHDAVVSCLALMLKISPEGSYSTEEIFNYLMCKRVDSKSLIQQISTDFKLNFLEADSCFQMALQETWDTNLHIVEA